MLDFQQNFIHRLPIMVGCTTTGKATKRCCDHARCRLIRRSIFFPNVGLLKLLCSASIYPGTPPALYDPILNLTYPLNLTTPETVPTCNEDIVYYPARIANITNATAEAFVQLAVAEVLSIIRESNGGLYDNCSKCVAALHVGKLAAQVAPERVPAALVSLCISTGFGSNSSCTASYAPGNFGAVWTQVLAFADVIGLDGRYICNFVHASFCSSPSLTPLNMTGLFPKSKVLIICQDHWANSIAGIMTMSLAFGSIMAGLIVQLPLKQRSTMEHTP
jgi:hypothetical protein